MDLKQTSNGVIFSWRVNPHYQHTEQNKTQPESYFSCHHAFAAGSMWQQQIQHRQESLRNPNLIKQLENKANMKIQQKLLISN